MSNAEISETFFCPLTHKIMREPVQALDGKTYEREAIEEFFRVRDISFSNPVPSSRKTLIPNEMVQCAIESFLQANPEFAGDDCLYLPEDWKKQLVIAVKRNWFEQVRSLLAKDSRLLTILLEFDRSVFHLAAECASPQMTELIFDKLVERNLLDTINALPKPEDYNPANLNALLQEALEKGQLAKADQLHSIGADPIQRDGTSGVTLLHYFACKGLLEQVNWLVSKGMMVDTQSLAGDTPLHFAIRYGQLKMAQLLVDQHHADKLLANAAGITPQAEALTTAATTENGPQIVCFLTGESNAAQLPELHLAVKLNDLRMAENIIKRNEENVAQVMEARNAENQTPLLAAVELGHAAMAKLLIEKHADLSVADDQNRSALHLAVARRDTSMIQALLSTQPAASTLLKAVTTNGDSALHTIVQSLAPTPEQPLPRKIEEQHMKQCIEIIKLLVSHGIDHKLKNAQNQTAFDLARAQKRVAVAMAIERAAFERKSGFWDEQLMTVKAQSAKVDELQKVVLNQRAALQRQGAELAAIILQQNQVVEELRWAANEVRVLKEAKLMSNDSTRRPSLMGEDNDDLIRRSSEASRHHAYQLLDCPPMTHGGAVTCLHVSPRHGIMASGSVDKTVKLWSSTYFTCRHICKGHSGRIRSVQFLGGDKLATASDDKTIKIWDINRGMCLLTIKGSDGWATCLQVRGRYFAAGSQDKKIRIFDISTLKCVQTIKGHKGGVLALQYLNGPTLASASDDCTVKLWEPNIGYEPVNVMSFHGHQAAVRALTLLPTDSMGYGGLLVSGSMDCTMKVWKTDTSQLAYDFKQYTGCVSSLCALDPQTFVNASSDREVLKIWSTSGKCLQALYRGNSGGVFHSGGVLCVHATPDSSAIFSGSEDKFIKVWTKNPQ